MSSDSKVTGALSEWIAGHGWDEYQKLRNQSIEACFAVSPSDPQAAAEAYPEIVEALEQLLASCIPGMNWTDETGQLLLSLARAALAKVGR